MSEPDPILTVLGYSTLAALVAALGAVPQALSGRLPLKVLGWASAIAAGLMLGVAYGLLYEGLPEAVLQGSAGAVLGLLFVSLAHRLTGVQDLDLDRLDELGPAYSHQIGRVSALHGAYEGVAIGAAMSVSLPFGISMALALAVHNIPEAMVLVAVLTARGVRLGGAAALAVATNATQILVSVVVFVGAGALPWLLPWAIGFAVGALLYLLMVELLPESYRQAGHTSIALVTVLAMGIVVALGSGGGAAG